MSAESPKSLENDAERRKAEERRELENYPRYHEAAKEMMIRHTQERSREDKRTQSGPPDDGKILVDMINRHEKEKLDLEKRHEDYREKGY